jgi:hypothetical protein
MEKVTGLQHGLELNEESVVYVIWRTPGRILGGIPVNLYLLCKHWVIRKLSVTAKVYFYKIIKEY